MKKKIFLAVTVVYGIFAYRSWTDPLVKSIYEEYAREKA